MLLDIDQLNLWFDLRDDKGLPYRRQVLFDVSLEIDKGETKALVGESGSGKSITAFSILRLLETTTNVETTGKITFDGQDLLSLLPEEIRKIRGNRIAMIFQEPMTSLNPVYTVGRQLLEPLLLHRQMGRVEATEEAIRLLQRTGIDNAEERLRSYPHQLSGGQRQRVMIAMALACRPALLIADEPTTALDVTVQAQILELIRDIQEEYEMAVLLITHDLQLVRKQASNIAIMQHGRIVETGPTEQVYQAPSHPYTKSLMSAIPQTRIGKPAVGPVLLSTTDLSCRFSLPGKWLHPFKRSYTTIDALQAANINLRQGTTLGIVGESGSGKTTLGLAILRLIPSSGAIIFEGKDLQGQKGRELRALRCDLQLVFQDPYSSLSPRFTAQEILEEGLRVHAPHLTGEAVQQTIVETLSDVGLEPEMAYRYPHEFSGGQRQRIAIARVLVLRPKLLILDEPTSALDVTVQGQIISLLNTLQQKYNMTYIFISHDLRVIRAMADHIAVMRRGEIIETGPAEQLFTRPQHDYTKALFAAALG